MNVAYVVATSSNARMPEKAHTTDTGYDCFSYTGQIARWNVPWKVPLGFKIMVPEGITCLIIPRSGRALKGWQVVDSPELIDPGYRGEVTAILSNTILNVELEVRPGDKVVQMIFIPQVKIVQLSGEDWDDLAEIEKTERGEKGFGSTGT